ncbi:hypothetical protein [Bacillus cereus]|uniref:hypothetical protein n=1 Tax=Bacillus cereus TaxID=1396 RepID=UPI003A83E0D1
MKRYKKMLMIAPLACMLGTGVFTLPTAFHADAAPVASVVNDTYGEGSTSSNENMTRVLYNRLCLGIESSPELRQKFKIADDEYIQREQGESSLNGVKCPAID